MTIEMIGVESAMGNSNNASSPVILAVAGKGGVGKTSISATMVRLLTEAHPDSNILAIDADPAVGLATALGIDVETTIDDIRKDVAEGVEALGLNSAVEVRNEVRYRLFDALVEVDGFSFIAIGRPETAGCYCKVNSYLKEVISILAENFDYVVIDGEAGIEQINRRVMEKVTHMILITDGSARGTKVVRTVRDVADELVMYERIGVIVNRIPSIEMTKYLDLGDIEVLSVIPSDDNLADFDIRGENVFYLPSDSAVVEGTRTALKNFDII